MLRHFDDAEAMVEALRPEVPVYCLRPRVLAEAAERFLARFPGRVLYAVKANPAPEILDPLHAAGIRHFDTASITEIALIKGRFPEASAYFMHPVKSWSAIRAAWHDYGVRHFILDHRDELAKLAQMLEGAGPELVAMVRLATPGGGAVFDLSTKFGAPPDEAAALLRGAAAAGFTPGLAFHVGSQCAEPAAYRRALALSREVVDRAGVAIGFLDLGGGFPASYAGTDVPPFEAYMAAVEAGLAETGLAKDCELMCEPGRALVAHAMSLVVQVQLRRDGALYVNDGIYGSLHGARIGYRYPARLIQPSGAETMAFKVFGPTCDGLDVLPDPLVLPADIRAGDWIEFGVTGAYGNALRTGFNGFMPDTFVTVEAPFTAAVVGAPESVLA